MRVHATHERVFSNRIIIEGARLVRLNDKLVDSRGSRDPPPHRRSFAGVEGAGLERFRNGSRNREGEEVAGPYGGGSPAFNEA